MGYIENVIEKMAMGQVHNLGLTLASGVLRITQADGSAFVPGNSHKIGMVVCQSAITPGKVVKIPVQANTHYLNDATSGSSTIVGQLWTTITGRAYNSVLNEYPLFLYAVNRDDTEAGLYFALCPSPVSYKTQALAGYMGWNGNPSAISGQYSLFAMTDDNISAAVGVPMTMIGGVKAKKSAGDDWTIQTLSTYRDTGIGVFPFGPTMLWAPGHGNVADANTFFVKAGAPVFNQNSYSFSISPGGLVRCHVRLSGDGGTDGSTADDAILALPYVPSDAGTDGYYGQAYVKASVTGTNYRTGLYFDATVGVKGLALIDDDAGTRIKNNDFGNGDRALIASFTYKAFSA